MSSFLDSTGLSRLVSKIADYFAKKDGSYPNMNVGTVNGYTVGKSVPSDAKFTDTTYPKAVKNITRSGTTFTATCYDGTTFTFTQQDNNTTYSAGSGLSLSGTTFSLKTGYTTSGKNYKVQLDTNGNPYVNVPWTDNNTTYNFSGTTFRSGNKDTEGHDCNSLTDNGLYYYTSNGPSTSLGASTNDGAVLVQNYSSSWVSQLVQDYRNGNIFVRGRNNGTWTAWKKVDAGTVNGYTVGKSVPSDAKFTDTTYPKAVKNITRSGTTFTATCYDGTTFTFTQQDNNTTYSAGTGIGLSGTTFNNQGIRDCYWDSTNDKVYVDKGGQASRFTVGYASRAGRMDNWRIYTAKQPCAALVTTTASSTGTAYWCARIVILETGVSHQVIDLICGSRGNNLLFTAGKLHSAGSWTTKLYAVKNADYKYTFYIEVQNMKTAYINYHVTQYQSYGTVALLGTTSTSFSGSAASTITIT